MIVFENAQGRLEDFDGMAVGVHRDTVAQR